VIFTATKLKGAFVIEPERQDDHRGFFARTWCQQEFAAHELNACLVQCNISFNKKKGTLRGMHYQASPYAEDKLVRCTMGAIYDVIIDLRLGSPTFKQHIGVALTAENRRMLYVPEGFAHGFQTLEDNTEVFYQMSEFYVPEYARGIRWNDPAFNIRWPADERIILERDQTYPDFSCQELHNRGNC
jgi:dTDP-4-dehydrorhamnose 3,5-epimerase